MIAFDSNANIIQLLGFNISLEIMEAVCTSVPSRLLTTCYKQECSGVNMSRRHWEHVHRREGGTDNCDPETWSGTKPQRDRNRSGVTTSQATKSWCPPPNRVIFITPKKRKKKFDQQSFVPGGRFVSQFERDKICNANGLQTR